MATTIGLLHQVAENSLVTGRYCKRFYPKDCWVGTGAEISENATTGQLLLYREPITDTIMLAPLYNVDADTTDAACTQTGGTWAEVQNLWGTTCKYLEQTDSTASTTTVKPTTAYSAGQAFWIDLFLRENSSADYTVQIDWGLIWRMTIRRDGACVLLHKGTPEAGEGDYKVVSKGTLTEGAGSLFGQRYTLSFWPLKRKVMLVKCGLSDHGKETRTMLLDEDAPALMGSGTDPWTITYEDSPKVTVSGGSYVVGFRKMTYESLGQWLSPVANMHELRAAEGGPGYTAVITPTVDWVNWGGAASVTMCDADGVALADAADKTTYRLKLVMTPGTGNNWSPHFFWAQVDVGEDVALNGALQAQEGSYVQKLSETLSLEDGSHNVTVEFRPLELTDPGGLGSYALKDCINAYCTLSIGGTARTTFYTADPDWRVFEKHGQLVWPNCQSRLQRLKHYMISDATAYDGMEHNLAVTSLLELTGLVVGDDFYCAADALPETSFLPIAPEDEDALFRYANGTTVYDAIKHICDKFSGWHLHTGSDGKVRYEPLNSTTLQGTFSTTSTGVAENRRIRSWQTRADSSQFYNQIWVVGEADNGDILVGFWQAPTSWEITTGYGGTPGHPDAMVGEQRKLILIDPALNTQAHVDQALSVLQTRHGQPKLLATMTSGFDAALRPGQWIEADNAPESGLAGISMSNWKILSMTTEVTQDDANSTYELEWQGVWSNLA